MIGGKVTKRKEKKMAFRVGWTFRILQEVGRCPRRGLNLPCVCGPSHYLRDQVMEECSNLDQGRPSTTVLVT